jgi:antirestriction protein
MDVPPEPQAGTEPPGNDNEENETRREDRPRIYVANLSDYNAGILHGEWIDADQEPEELHVAVQAMLARSASEGAEESAIHDYEGFGHYAVDEYTSLERVSRIARGIAEHGLAFSAWAAHVENEEDALDRFEDAYRGSWDSIEDYASELLCDLGYDEAVANVLPELLQPYVKLDVESFARDLELSGDITAVRHADGVWIFEGSL